MKLYCWQYQTNKINTGRTGSKDGYNGLQYFGDVTLMLENHQ